MTTFTVSGFVRNKDRNPSVVVKEVSKDDLKDTITSMFSDTIYNAIVSNNNTGAFGSFYKFDNLNIRNDEFADLDRLISGKKIKLGRNS